jgi:hypothetical protein
MGSSIRWLRVYVVGAALKIRSEPARTAILDALREPPTVNVRRIVIDALRLSPGDTELARQVRLAIGWLDSRIESPDP